ncbi:structural maintenance of chromosomes protein 5 [Nematocida minor]|uniref:structural maintenance of chromosomes protein 5 n=1 Tax=Nematocida minor TaxID=1912983 RepID=UPI00221EF5E4|nr:structural maintenance of chromosomes protein 5 [Nematocida minor]KAI5192541.1 structural maintenance of chromosomes protein 5 [Nematocida minor]
MGSTFLHSLTLTNFQKYKNKTFTFSPHGNLIAGLNGSGKSTIAAAIALTLGGNNKTIGKTLATHEIIKYGEAKAVSEIVIKTDKREELSEIVKINGRAKEINVVITRIITALGSTYKINSIPASFNQVKEVTEALNIQINNLGQFLPQDRVTEFSGLAEEEQLETSLRTCDPEMLRKKKELEEIDDNLSNYKQKLQIEIDQQSQLKGKIAALEGESKKLKEFLDRKQQISLLQCKIKWVEYVLLKEQYDKLKEEADRNKEEYSKSQTKVDELEKQYVEEKDRLSRSKEENAEILDIGELTERVREIKENEEEENKLADRIETIQKRISRIEQEKFEIKQWKEEKKTEKPKPKLTEHLKEELNRLEEENRACKMQDSSWQIDSAMKSTEIKNIEMSIKKEEEKETRLLEALKSIHADTYTTLKLMESSEKKWEVDLPAILTMKIAKEEYKEELSSQLNVHALTCFVCHSRESFQEFVHEFKDKRNLAINVVERQNSTQTGGSAHTQRPREEAPLDEKYGMVYLSECIDAPPAVKEFLNIFSKLSYIPVTKISLTNEHEFFSKYKKITRIISNKRVIEIKRSSYTKDETLSIYPISKGIDILTKPQDSTLKNKLEELKAEREQRTQNRQNVLRKREVVEKRIKELAHLKETDHLESEKYERRKRAAQAYVERTEEIEKESISLKEEEKMVNTALKKLKNEGKIPWKKLPLNDLLKKISEVAERSKLMQKQYELLESMQHTLLTEKQGLKDQQVKNILAEHNMNELKKQAKQKNAEANAIHEMKPDSSEIKMKLKEMPTCIKTLTGLLAQEKARAELSIVNYAAIDDYEACRLLLENQEKTLRKQEKEKGKYESIKKQKEADLKSEIDLLIEKINENADCLFKSAGIKAEVLVEYAESPRRWKLVLKVQFRTEGKLEVLSAGRHSGGEKAVSIILYLLSMQRLSESPFLLVDEINQGMDAGHEKTIHSMLVGTKAANSKQIIVITPKLISGLDYAPSTRVHIIMETA